LGVPVYELENMPASYFAEYMEYYSLSPFGEERDNLHAGMIAAVIANSNRGKRSKALSISDFMFKSDYDREREQVASMMTFMKGITKNG